MQSTIDELSRARSRANNTDLVSYLIPAGASLEGHRATLRTEKGVSANIKDRGHGRAVARALGQLDGYLATVKSLPKTGLALYAGQWV